MDNVVCVHGLWMPGLEMTLLRHRLRSNHGFQVSQFSYKSVTGRLECSTDALRQFIDDNVEGRAQIVAHSLGGVMALHMLRRYPDAPVDRVVCLGSPLVDCGPARKFLQYNFGKAFIGDTLIEGVLEKPLGEWTGEQRVGVIAGTLPFGGARFIMKLEDPNDGVVSAVETKLPGIADYIEVPVTHAGLILSSMVAQRSADFIRDGRF
ncbi:MAG: alpha/beta hydrolase [Gammaproteobacteria bacterium]|nr:alpha/beta hydrolase [Gammaproteobacteria bacterium]